MSFGVLLPVFSHAVRHVRPGLSYHLACQALALRRVAQEHGARVYLASTTAEDAPGLWARLRAAFTPEELCILEDERDSFTRVAAELIRREDRLIAHVQGTRQLWALRALKKEYPDRLKIVYTVHSFRHRSWQRWPNSWVVSRLLHKYADYTIFLAPFAAAQFIGAGTLFRGGRAGIVPLGVEPGSGETGQPAAGQIDAKLRNLLEESRTFRFIYLAAFKPGKGHVWLLEGAAPALRKHRHASLILAGWGDEGLKNHIRRRAEELDVAPQIVMPGSVPRTCVPWVLQRCHVGVAAACSETFGQCITEPMAAGLPVVGAPTGAGQWLISDYQTGIGVPYGDRKGLAKAVEYLITHPEQAALMGRNAAAMVETTLNWDHIVQSHFRIYQSLVDDNCEGLIGEPLTEPRAVERQR